MLDLIALVVLGLGFFAGYSRGVIKTLFSIISIVLGILIAMKASPVIINFLESTFNLGAKQALIIGFIVTLILVIMIISYFGNMIEKLLKKVHLNVVNKLAGGALFAILFMLALGMGEKFLTELAIITPDQIEQSVSYPIVTALPNQAADVFEGFKPAFKEFWEKTRAVIDGASVPAEK